NHLRSDAAATRTTANRLQKGQRLIDKMPTTVKKQTSSGRRTEPVRAHTSQTHLNRQTTSTLGKSIAYVTRSAMKSSPISPHSKLIETAKRDRKATAKRSESQA
ncbi:hypothetical protein CGZ80_06920, partial [Rhodopirellula sp. MGV]